MTVNDASGFDQAVLFLIAALHQDYNKSIKYSYSYRFWVQTSYKLHTTIVQS